MKKLVLPALLLSALSACASNSVTLAPGENGKVAVLNPKTMEETAILDKAGSVATVHGTKAGKPTAIDQATYDKRHGALVGVLPKAPRGFTLYFLPNSTDPTETSKALVPTMFDEIKSRPGADIQITGHTDTTGTIPSNDVFSLRRAAEIASYLFSLGLDKAIVRLAGRGERELKVQTPDETPNDENRRVEVLVR